MANPPMSLKFLQLAIAIVSACFGAAILFSTHYAVTCPPTGEAGGGDIPSWILSTAIIVGFFVIFATMAILALLSIFAATAGLISLCATGCTAYGQLTAVDKTETV